MGFLSIKEKKRGLAVSYNDLLNCIPEKSFLQGRTANWYAGWRGRGAGAAARGPGAAPRRGEAPGAGAAARSGVPGGFGLFVDPLGRPRFFGCNSVAIN